LVGRGVGQAQGGTIGDLEPPAPPELAVVGQELFGVLGSGVAGALEDFQGQAFAGLAIGAGALVHRGGQVGATEQGLNLAHHFAAGGGGMEHLPEKAPKGAGQRIDALTAVIPRRGWGQKVRRQEVEEEFFDVRQRQGAQRWGAQAEGGQAGPPVWKERRLHVASIYTGQRVDRQAKMERNEEKSDFVEGTAAAI
jgi:hypothetical protein